MTRVSAQVQLGKAPLALINLLVLINNTTLQSDQSESDMICSVLALPTGGLALHGKCIQRRLGKPVELNPCTAYKRNREKNFFN